MIGKLFDKFIEWTLNRQEAHMLKKATPKRKMSPARRRANARRRSSKK